MRRNTYHNFLLKWTWLCLYVQNENHKEKPVFVFTFCKTSTIKVQTHRYVLNNVVSKGLFDVYRQKLPTARVYVHTRQYIYIILYYIR